MRSVTLTNMAAQPTGDSGRAIDQEMISALAELGARTPISLQRGYGYGRWPWPRTAARRPV